MRSYRHSLLALFFLAACSAWAAEPARPNTAQAQIQAEQGKKQALADALWRFLKAEPERKRRLDEAIDRLYGLTFKDNNSSDKPPNSTSIGLRKWQEALASLRTLELSPAAANNLKVLEQAMKEAERVLSAIPAVVANAPPMRRIERQQALLAAASALGSVKQRAWELDAQLTEEARRAASGAQVLADQAFMLPAPGKGEKP